ncbi:P-loop containing nucleoside triphosphate hydrolase protein [Phlyctochytrium arcticum]|nr:P-loop containing nucleoside triphosphate hydrolase protein [Phlyctochytrium arcticum]
MTSVKFDSKDYPGVFNFDRVFDWTCTQEDVFEYAAGAVIDDVMRGYNGTIFAYGQTGSGKTHTMMGDMENDSMKGLTPRLVENIFATIFASPPHVEFTVRVSFMEIYMERIRDLLNPANDNLPIHEEKTRGVYVKGLLEVFVGSIEEVYEAMRRGQSSRMTAQTNMNAESSRSHSTFVLTIQQKNLNDGSIRTGKLSLVDLAGSEKVGKTGASGQTLEEAKKINKSLSSLGMVINALTDGKSSHIPYRDSKLTRILQESIGGNSRTTLIINCSPSSFNEAETLSTLRFGMRAKTIKNKAKINAELSSSELKTLLKNTKADLASLQGYCKAMEGELSVWRSGGTVMEKDWVSPSAFATGGKSALAAMAPSVVEATRASTPALPVVEDEREDFLRRENELSDQLAEKEAELEQLKSRVESMMEELTVLRKDDSALASENKELSTTVDDLKLQLERLTFESKDSAIHMDSLKDAHVEQSREIDELKRKIVNLQASAPSTMGVSDEEKERRKKEKMEQMMAEFDPSSAISDKEKQLRETLRKLAQMKETSRPPTTSEDIESQHYELIETKSQLAQQEALIDDLMLKNKIAQEEANHLSRRKGDLDSKVVTLQKEYEELLERTIGEELHSSGPEAASMFEDLKSKLEMTYEMRREHEEKELEDFRVALSHKDEELARLTGIVTEQTTITENLKAVAETMKSMENGGGLFNSTGDPVVDAHAREDIERLRKSMAQQLAEFDVMKKKLMRDLQNRCEKVVELEISLDDVREQYNTILRTSNSRAQQQKLAFLERNLEQLTSVQKTLVEQNTSLKKEVAVAERKLSARNERITSLEALLQEAHAKVEAQNQKFESQLASMREKVQEARAHTSNTSSSWLYSSRIAKPLRGGGGAFLSDDPSGGEADPDSYNPEPIGFGLGGADSPAKRSSWYISLLTKR